MRPRQGATGVEDAAAGAGRGRSGDKQLTELPAAIGSRARLRERRRRGRRRSAAAARFGHSKPHPSPSLLGPDQSLALSSRRAGEGGLERASCEPNGETVPF